MKRWVCVGGFLWAFGFCVKAQSVGDYQSVGNVDLNSATNWNYYNGNAWETATLPPNGNVTTNNTITVSAGHQWSNGSSSSIPVGVTLINQGTTGTFTTSAANKVVVNGTYVHNTTSSISTILQGMTIGTGSLFIYRGSNTLTPAVSFSNRTYYNLRIESTSGSLSLNLAGFAGGANPFTVNGSLTIGENVTLNQNTFTGSIFLNGDVYLNGSLNIHSFTILSGKQLSMGNNAVLTIPSGNTVLINGTADAGLGKFTGDGSLVINGTLRSAHPDGISATGNCQQAGLSFGAAGEVEFYGSSQVIRAATLSNLKINSTGYAELGADLQVNGNVDLSNGKLKLGNYNLTISGTANGNTTAYIQTNATGSVILQNVTTARNVPVGNSTYNPLQLSDGNGLDWNFRVSDVIEPAGFPNANKAVQRTWHITPSGTATGVDIVFEYNDADASQTGSGFLTSQDVQVWHYHNSNWTTASLAITPTGTATGGVRTVTLSNQDEFSDFSIANLNSVLPLTLHSLSAETDNGLVKLRFINDAEKAIEKYFIERVENGVFTVVKTVLPLKNDGSAVSYHFTDHPPHYRLLTYRVRAKEINGNMLYSNIFRVQPSEADGIILVTDRNEFFWKAKLPEGNYLIRIYNICGTLISEERRAHKSGEAAGRFMLRQKGMYILVIDGIRRYRRMFSFY